MGGRCRANTALFAFALVLLMFATCVGAIAYINPEPADGLAPTLIVLVLAALGLICFAAGYGRTLEWDSLGVRRFGWGQAQELAWADVVDIELSGARGLTYTLRGRSGQTFKIASATLGHGGRPLCDELLRRWRPCCERQRERLAHTGLDFRPDVREERTNALIMLVCFVVLSGVAAWLLHESRHRAGFGRQAGPLLAMLAVYWLVSLAACLSTWRRYAALPRAAHCDSAGLRVEQRGRTWELPWPLVDRLSVAGGQQLEVLTLEGGGHTLCLQSRSPEYLAVAAYAAERSVNAEFVCGDRARAGAWQSAADPLFPLPAPPPADERPRRALKRLQTALLVGLMVSAMALRIGSDLLKNHRHDDRAAQLELWEHPAHAQAKVTRLCGNPGAHHVHYRFQLPDRRSFEGQRPTPGVLWDGWKLGAPLDVLYAPSHPETNRAADQPRGPRPYSGGSERSHVAEGLVYGGLAGTLLLFAAMTLVGRRLRCRRRPGWE